MLGEGIGEGDKRLLLKMARETLEAHLSGQPRPEYDVQSTALMNPQGAFVTLHKYGELRGCIGNVTTSEPLHKVVRECAIHAATLDPRFRPVTGHELKDIDIEISVLSPLKKIDGIEEIEIGKHGLVIATKERNLGLLLPQVAGDRGWTREQFLEAICNKAFLPRGAWKEPNYILYTFSAQVFGEEDYA